MPDALAKLGVPDQSRGRAYSTGVVVLAILLCLATVGANVVVNPRAEFPWGGLPPLVPDRVHQRVQGFLAQDDARDLVLGASRANDIAGLPGREDLTANLAVAGSTPEDWLDLYRFARTQGTVTENVIVAVDPSTLTDVFTPRVPSSADADLVRGHPDSLVELGFRAMRTLSMEYTLDSGHSLKLRYITGYPPPQFTGPHPAFARPDLLAEYHAGRFDPDEIHPEVAEQFAKSFGASSALVEGRAEALLLLVDEILQDGAAAWLVLPPYQPVALVDLEESYPLYRDRHDGLLSLLGSRCPSSTAKPVPFHLTDGTVAADVGVDPREFYDQSHPTPRGSAQLMEAVAAGQVETCHA